MRTRRRMTIARPRFDRRVAFLSFVLALTSCGDGNRQENSLSGSAMGTTYNVVIVGDIAGDGRRLQDSIVATINDMTQQFSTYDPGSAISQFNRHSSTDWFDTTIELCTAMQDALAISRQTNGAFDPTVGRLVNLWGFGPDGMVLEPPPRESIAAALDKTGYQKVHTDCAGRRVRKDHPDVYVDLSGYAKGLAVDRVAMLLDQFEIPHYLVEIGGEVRVHGLNGRQVPWKIAIQKPDAGDSTIQSAIDVSNASVATSGDYRNYFSFGGVRYSHTIDSRSGFPVSHATASVTVVSPTAAYADAMATALLVMGEHRGPEFARDNNLAASFIIRRDAGIEEVTTPAFAAIGHPQE